MFRCPSCGHRFYRFYRKRTCPYCVSATVTGVPKSKVADTPRKHSSDDTPYMMPISDSYTPSSYTPPPLEPGGGSFGGAGASASWSVSSDNSSPSDSSPSSSSDSSSSSSSSDSGGGGGGGGGGGD